MQDEGTAPSSTLATAKVVILGDLGVGKTSLIQRICGNGFSEAEESTIGASYRSVSYGDCRLDFWDTAGQERYRSLVGLYLRGVHVIWVVTPVNAKDTENRPFYEPWSRVIDRAQAHDAVRLHVYSKGDMDHKKDQLHKGCIVTSARDNIGIEELLKLTTECGRRVYMERQARQAMVPEKEDVVIPGRRLRCGGKEQCICG